MDQRVSLITLGVNNLSESRAFYKKIGWNECVSISNEHIAFYQLNGFLIALFPVEQLLEYEGKKSCSHGGVTIAVNFTSKEEVDKAKTEFLSAGGKVIAEPKEFPWAYSGYVSDPDGHVWEISYVPSLLPDEQGNIWVK